MFPVRASAPQLLEPQSLVYVQDTALIAYYSVPEQSLKDWVRVTHPEIYRVIDCESGWNQEARGKAGEIGLAQFMLPTWNMFNQIRETNLDVYNPSDQVDMIVFAFENGYQEHWTCWKSGYGS